MTCREDKEEEVEEKVKDWLGSVHDEKTELGTDQNNDDKEIDQGSGGSPQAVLDRTLTGSTDSGSSEGIAIPRAEQSLVTHPHHSHQWRSVLNGLMLRKKRSMMRAITFPPATKVIGFRRRLEKMMPGKDHHQQVSGPDVIVSVPEISDAKPSWRNFDYNELKVATDAFSADNLIGQGGHAEVYKGRLTDGQLVAVKRLMKSDNNEDRITDFLTELGIIAHVNHPNVSQLIGFSAEEGLHLVLQFSHHGSLASLLHGGSGSKDALKWKVRFNIALGVAQGLLYLHEDCHRRIIHRDIKASNILLTEDYQPQISDFGLAKWFPDKWPHHVIFPIEGTFGYLAPEYFMHGIVNEKTDVFAYGVLLLELVTGRKAVDSSRQSLVIWAKPHLDANNVTGLVDPSLADNYDPEELTCILSIASMCIHHASALRPNMNTVVRLLNGEHDSDDIVQKLRLMRPPMLEAGDLEEYTRSSYLNDLHRHKQLALE